MDNYTVEFRIYGSKEKIEEISSQLPLIPTTIQRQGDLRDRKTVFRESMWGYARTSGDGLKEWRSLEDGIADLLVDLQSLRPILNHQKDISLVFWCGHTHDTFGSGPTLSNSLVESVSSIGASISISTYYYDGSGLDKD